MSTYFNQWWWMLGMLFNKALYGFIVNHLMIFIACTECSDIGGWPQSRPSASCWVVSPLSSHLTTLPINYLLMMIYIYIVWLTLITSYSHSCRLDEILSTNRCKSMQIRAYLHLQSSTFVNQLDPFLFIKFSRGFDPENSRTAGDPWEIAQGPWSAQWSVERSQACAHWSRTAEDRWRKSSAVKQHRCGTPARNVQCWLSNSN